jgi:hypothetical protein
MGKAQRTFIELAAAPPTTPMPFTDVLADLPGPGVYYLVSVWSPRILEPPDPDTPKISRIHTSGRFGKVYATSLPVRVEFTSTINP